ncbi:MAG: hypothetical protein H7834_10290 [Magnetococcus sp. YQC-9]
MSGTRESWEEQGSSGMWIPPVVRQGEPDGDGLACPLTSGGGAVFGEESVPAEVVLAPLAFDTVLTPEDLRRLLKIVAYSGRAMS